MNFSPARKAKRAGSRYGNGSFGCWRNYRASPRKTAGGSSAIIPWIVGDEQRALDLARSLQQEGLLVPAIRYPTVAKGAARLRITVSAAHTEAQIAQLGEALRRLAPTRLRTGRSRAAEQRRRHVGRIRGHIRRAFRGNVASADLPRAGRLLRSWRCSHRKRGRLRVGLAGRGLLVVVQAGSSAAASRQRAILIFIFSLLRWAKSHPPPLDVIITIF